MAKVTGIGGIFIKFKNPTKMKEWYSNALGLNVSEYGVLFTFNGNGHPKAYLQLGTFAAETNYFGAETQQYMVNFRVDNLTELHTHLVALNTVIIDEIETYEYGSFLHIEDPEGNRLELWEPVDSEFDKMKSNEVEMT